MDEVPEIEVESGLRLVAVLAEAGLCESRGQARRLVAQGVVRVDSVVATNPDYVLVEDAFVQVGKKRFLRVRVGEPELTWRCPRAVVMVQAAIDDVEHMRNSSGTAVMYTPGTLIWAHVMAQVGDAVCFELARAIEAETS